MAATIRAHDLGSCHAKGVVGVARDGAGDIVEVCWPSAARLELLVCGVEGRVAGSACVNAGGGHVFVKFAGAGGFGALLAKDAKLFCGC